MKKAYQELADSGKLRYCYLELEKHHKNKCGCYPKTCLDNCISIENAIKDIKERMKNK